MRRPNGTGTITKMSGARRKPYAVRVPARDRKGRVVQKYLSYHATMRDAMEAAPGEGQSGHRARRRFSLLERLLGRKHQ